MYIQITTRCNMECAHCCSSCTEVGEDITLETFRNALKFSNNYEEHITLGGGEPTIHPQFVQMLFEAMGKAEYVWLATNGSQTEISLVLAKLAEKGAIGCALSIDDYHEEIDEKVIKAFTRSKASDNKDDCREIRNVSSKEINTGRCDFGKEGCVCPDVFVKPNGDVFGCACDEAPSFGNINTEVNMPLDWMYGECSKEQERLKKENEV